MQASLNILACNIIYIYCFRWFLGSSLSHKQDPTPSTDDESPNMWVKHMGDSVTRADNNKA